MKSAVGDLLFECACQKKSDLTKYNNIDRDQNQELNNPSPLRKRGRPCLLVAVRLGEQLIVGIV